MSDDQTLHGSMLSKVNVGSLSVVVALLVQTGGMVWWASGVERRVSTLEQEIKPVAATSETVAVLDERTKAIGASIEHIERILDSEQLKRADAP